jgi:hypothetical protein
MKPLCWVVIIALFLLGGSGPVQGQSITGRVLVAGDTTGVAGVDLLLTDSAGLAVARVQSDGSGAFRLAAPSAGSYEIVASRIGLATRRVVVEVGEREVLEVELRMAEEAIPLEPIVVVARRQIQEGTLDEFYDRMARMKQAGRGWFMTREEIEGSGAADLPFLLYRAPGVFLQPVGHSGYAIQMRRPGAFCTPAYFVDGLPAGGFTPVMGDLEGIEVYRGRFESVEGYWPNDCGMVFLWRRKDWGNPFSWSKLAIAGGFAALGIALAFIL